MMIPITRKEKYINEIVGGGDTAPETPQTREEFFFADILGEVIAPSPITRAEKYLAKIANKYSGELPEPVTRIERFLARAAGMNVSIPTPITREEMFWADYAFIVEKEISGIPPLTFKAKKAGTLKNYRIYGNTETKTRSYSGSAPLSFPIADGSVSNYRIYGNTVNGGSVGDKTVNILPLSRTPITETHGDFLCEYDGLGTITLTTDKDNAATDGEFVVPLIQNFTIPVSIGQGGTGCFQINNSISDIATNNIKLYYNNTQIDTWNLNELNRVHSTYKSMGNKTIDSISVRINDSGTNRKITIKPAFVENVTEQVPFEPYGYRIPITNNSETANIYLDEPLKKSGDNADYIDYAEQKRYNADGTSEDVTLPVLPAQSSTNSLSVGTAVQTSSVAADVAEVVSCGDRTGNLFDGEFLQGYWADADGLFVVSDKWISTKKIPCKANAQYTFSSSFLSRWAGFFWYDENDNYLSNSTAYNITLLTKTSPSNAAYMAIDIAGYPTWENTISPSDVTDFMLVEGSTPLPYEPYGYKVPVTVTNGTDMQTTNLYLPEPIKMVGDEAEYIDYAEQKMHRIGADDIDVTLPALPVLPGTNTLTVGTEVQPSGVEIKGEIQEVAP